jgi:hypothetical protein
VNRPEDGYFKGRARHVIATCAVLGIAALAAGTITSPERAWTSLLTAAFYYVTLALGAVVLLALCTVSNAAWIVPLKRVPEAMGGYLPVGALTMLLVLPGVHTLYHWSHADAAHDPVLKAKGAWLTAPFFGARMAIIFVLWIAFAAALRSASRKQDRDRDVAHTHRAVKLSAGFLVAGALSFSLASFDWLMSLSPHWQSTIFAFYNIAGMLAASTAAVSVGVIFLRRRGHLPDVGEAHLHDLSKLCFGFSTLWAYMWLSQYLLIWYANMPEETPYYIARTSGGWGFLFWANLIVGWFAPFTMLLQRSAKRSEGRLLAAGVVILIGRWLDVYLMSAPANLPEHPGIGLIELAGYLGLGALFVLVVERVLRGAPLIPRGDPYFNEGAHHHG